MSRSQDMVSKIIEYGLYEEGPSPDGEEPRSDMLQEIEALRATMNPATQKDFDDFVVWLNEQRYAFPGNVSEILQQMHPWQLQQVAQRFKQSVGT